MIVILLCMVKQLSSGQSNVQILFMNESWWEYVYLFIVSASWRIVSFCVQFIDALRESKREMAVATRGKVYLFV